LSCGRWRVIYLHWESAKLKSCARPQVLGSSLYYYLDCSSYSFSAPQAITHVSLQKGHCLQWTRVYPSSPTPHNGEADRHNERASAHYISPNPAFSIQSWKAAMQISGAWNLSTPGGI
jgi:putative component of membrane protein insertase Oxa1/YidC/SpoIIIJ protein YidD